MSALLLCVVALLACSTARLNSEGSQVATSSSAPSANGWQPDSCISLGYVVGHGGGTLGGQYISNDDLITYAMNDLRNQAAELGANYVQHDTPTLGVGGGDHGTNTTTATISGTAYRCSTKTASSESGASPTAAGSAPPPSTDAVAPSLKAQPAPSGALSESALAEPAGCAGFRFGLTSEEAKELCSAGGHQWVDGDEASACSSALVDMGAKAHVQLVFCDEQLCEVRASLQPEKGKYAAMVTQAYQNIRKRYGKPGVLRDTSAQCPRPKFADCVRAHEGTIVAQWRWDTRTHVQLETGVVDDRAVIQLIYASPLRAKSLEPGPAF